MMDQNQNLPQDDEQKVEKSESTLFSAPAPASANITKRQKASSIKKQRRMILILAIIVAAAIPLYFFVVKPIVEFVEEEMK